MYLHVQLGFNIIKSSSSLPANLTSWKSFTVLYRKQSSRCAKWPGCDKLGVCAAGRYRIYPTGKIFISLLLFMGTNLCCRQCEILENCFYFIVSSITFLWQQHTISTSRNTRQRLKFRKEMSVLKSVEMTWILPLPLNHTLL